MAAQMNVPVEALARGPLAEVARRRREMPGSSPEERTAAMMDPKSIADRVAQIRGMPLGSIDPSTLPFRAQRQF